MAIDTSNLYTEEIRIPSGDLIYKELTDGRLVIRCTTVADEKYLRGSKLDPNLTLRQFVR